MSTNVKKKSTAKGTKFSYKYTDLATIHEELEAQGITYSQYTEWDAAAGADYIYTVLKYGDNKECQPQRGARIISGNTLAGGNAAQEYGSALTYARRYSLLMALGWATEDDDAASVSATPERIDDRLDFDQLKAWLEKMKTVEEVEEAKKKCFAKYPKMTEKQRVAVEKIFTVRIEHLTDKISDGWQEAKAVR